MWQIRSGLSVIVVYFGTSDPLAFLRVINLYHVTFRGSISHTAI